MRSDTYLLAIHEDGDQLRLDVEAAMTEQHPRYAPRKPDEAYSYLPVAIVFRQPRSVEWIERSMKPIVAPDGETDYGTIDSLMLNGNRYEILGEWRPDHRQRVSADRDRSSVTQRAIDDHAGGISLAAGYAKAAATKLAVTCCDDRLSPSVTTAHSRSRRARVWVGTHICG